MFQQDWFEIVEAAPADVDWVRYWDLAGTDEFEGGKPAYTSGVKFGKCRSTGLYYVGNVLRVRKSALGVEQTLKNTASLDTKRVRIGIPQDPGQAGKGQYQHLVRLLTGYDVRRFLEGSEGDKPTRALALSAQAEAGNVKLVRGDWNDAYLQELCLFPNCDYADQVDATSGAYWTLEKKAVVTGARPVSIALAPAPFTVTRP